MGDLLDTKQAQAPRAAEAHTVWACSRLASYGGLGNSAGRSAMFMKVIEGAMPVPIHSDVPPCPGYLPVVVLHVAVLVVVPLLPVVLLLVVRLVVAVLLVVVVLRGDVLLRGGVPRVPDAILAVVTLLLLQGREVWGTVLETCVKGVGVWNPGRNALLLVWGVGCKATQGLA